MSDPDDASVAELIQRLTTQVSTLVRDEIALARAEMVAKARRLAVGAGLFAAAAAFVFFAAAGLTAAGVLGLALVVPGWAAALIVTVLLVVVAGVAALVGRSLLRRATPPVPTQAMQAVRDDLQTLKAAAHVGDRS